MTCIVCVLALYKFSSLTGKLLDGKRVNDLEGKVVSAWCMSTMTCPGTGMRETTPQKENVF